MIDQSENVIRITEDSLVEIIFKNYDKRLVDIDFLFRNTVKTYSAMMVSLGVPVSYDFSDRTNKRFFTNEFVKNYISLCKESEYQLVFYINTTNTNKFQMNLVKKLKTIFGNIFIERPYELSMMMDNYDNGNVETIEMLEFLFSKSSQRNLKKIKSFFKREGLTFLHDVYIENINNKMSVLTR
jgi:uncharacterized Fe-S center protein